MSWKMSAFISVSRYTLPGSGACAAAYRFFTPMYARASTRLQRLQKRIQVEPPVLNLAKIHLRRGCFAFCAGVSGWRMIWFC